MIIKTADLKSIIEASVRENFRPEIVSSVEVSMADGEHVENVIDVNIILNGTAERESMSSFGLKLRRAFDQNRIDGFPLVSFIAKKEFERRPR
jgi:hypothetical protein